MKFVQKRRNLQQFIKKINIRGKTCGINLDSFHYFLCTHRKSCFGDAKVQKSRGKSAKLSPQKAELQPGSPNQRELRSKETPEKMVLLRSGAERDNMLPCKEEPELSCQIEDLPFMSTTEMYLCCWNQPPLSPLRETSPKKEEEVASEWTPHVVHDMLIICKPILYISHLQLLYPSRVLNTLSVDNSLPLSSS